MHLFKIVNQPKWHTVCNLRHSHSHRYLLLKLTWPGTVSGPALLRSHALCSDKILHWEIQRRPETANPRSFWRRKSLRSCLPWWSWGLCKVKPFGGGGGGWVMGPVGWNVIGEGWGEDAEECRALPENCDQPSSPYRSMRDTATWGK